MMILMGSNGGSGQAHTSLKSLEARTLNNTSMHTNMHNRRWSKTTTVSTTDFATLIFSFKKSLEKRNIKSAAEEKGIEDVIILLKFAFDIQAVAMC